MQSQDIVLQRSLHNFYTKDNNLEKILPIITGDSHISLRIVDWFTTNYSKQYCTLYLIEHPNYKSEKERFKVYNNYKLQLKSFSKKRFDPFCRWERIRLQCDQNKFIETTIGQLNFFRWVIENKILEYIETHFEDIEKDKIGRAHV